MESILCSLVIFEQCYDVSFKIFVEKDLTTTVVMLTDVYVNPYTLYDIYI